MHTPPPLTPVRTLATVASVLIAAVCVSNLYGTWTAWNAHSVVADYVAGLPGVTDSDLYAADDDTMTAVWVNLLVFVASVTVFLTWLWRARVNAEHLSGVHHRLGRGWTIGSWFCPVVNLWFPRRIVDDTWRASPRRACRPAPDRPAAAEPAGPPDHRMAVLTPHGHGRHRTPAGTSRLTGDHVSTSS